MRKGYVRPLDLRHGVVDLTHGSGGRAMAQLVEELFARRLGNAYLGQGNDGAVLPMPPGATCSQSELSQRLQRQTSPAR